MEMDQTARPTLIDGLPAKIRSHGGRAGRPFVTLTYAQSLDGSIAAGRDQPLALSGEDSSLLTHQLRAAHDAILIGIGTLLADDPRLTARKVNGPHPQPVVVDSHLRFPLSARLFQHPDHKPWIFTAENSDPARKAALESMGAVIYCVPSQPDGGLDLPSLVAELGRLGVASLMVEGGARIISSFLARCLADWLVITIAPVFVGGVHAIEGADVLREFPLLQGVHCAQLGHDIVIWGDLERGER